MYIYGPSKLQYIVKESNRKDYKKATESTDKELLKSDKSVAAEFELSDRIERLQLVKPLSH